MPNHITNIIKCIGDRLQVKAMMEAIMDNEYGVGSIDFNKIIPMPESLQIEAGSRTDKGLKAYKDFIEVYTLGGTLKPNLLKIPLERENVFLRQRTDIKQDEWDLGRTAFQNLQLYGAPTWYEWSIGHWGTKWNAYDFSEYGDPGENGEIFFHTAWSAPHPVIRAIAERFPDVVFVHEWADEDIGQNCGRHIYQGGERTEEYYPEADVDRIQFAARVMDLEPCEYGLYLNASGTDYIRLPEEEYEVIEIAGQTALFANERITSSQIPKGLYVSHLRHSDDGERFATLEPTVTVNQGGSVITKQAINFGKQGYLSLDEGSEPNFTGESATMVDFLAREPGEDEYQEQKMGEMSL